MASTNNVPTNLSNEAKRALLAKLLEQKARKPEIYPLSFAQQRLWFFDQWEQGSSVYNIPAAIRLRGELDREALEKSLNEIVRRHESLRTRFATREGEAVQVVEVEMRMKLEEEDLRGEEEGRREEIAKARAEEEAQRGFNLSEGGLIRGKILKLGEREHVLLLTMHHIISDGWSIGVLINEVSTLYKAFLNGEPSPLPDLEIQYADYAVWQRDWMQGEKLEKQLDYWKQQLAGELPTLQLPTDRPRPAVQTYRGAKQSLWLSKSLAKSLRDLSRKEGATLFITLLAAFKALLYRYSGQEDIIIGTPIANRNRSEIEALIGFFVNTLVLRTDLSGNPRFIDLLRKEREVALGAYAHQDVPFEKLTQALQVERDLSRSPLFQVLFMVQNSQFDSLELPGLTLEPMDAGVKTAKFDLTVVLEDSEQGLLEAFEYNTDLFEDETITRMLTHFEILLEAVAANPEQRISDLPVLTEREQNQLLVEWNDTKTDFGQKQTLQELIESQVERTPYAVALACDGEKISYKDLNNRANQLARYLRQKGVGPEVCVGVCAERSLEMVVGLLGILKAGGAYVPLDPAYPKHRLAVMIEESNIPVVLTLGRLQQALPEQQAELIKLDDDWNEIDSFSEENLELLTEGKNLAYVIYTSGSTGKPKGAMNTHEAITNRLLWMQQQYPLKADDAVLQKTPYSFDVSVWEFFWPLMTGARLVMAEPGGHKDSRYLVKVIEEEKITTLHFVPSMLQVFLEEEGLERCQSVRRVICSGEALGFELERKFYKRMCGELHNLYGPTEAAVDVTYWACEKESGKGKVPIGRPISNLRMHILDKNLRVVPAGVPGALYIAGIGVGRGYLARPDLTADRFIPNPYALEEGERLYKTGDVARYLRDGSIEYLGREDQQVKLRGFRIELGEIEAALEEAGAREAAVIVREGEGGDKRLVGYVVMKEGEQLKAAELKKELKEKLPEYMVPSAIVVMDGLPLSANGKLDRKALPAPEGAVSDREREYVAPRTPVEELLAGVWAQVLNISRIGSNDDFFELGGHSLLATQVVSRIRQAFEVELSLRVLFENTQLAQLALAIENAMQDQRGLQAPPMALVPREQNLPLSFAQQRLWFLDQFAPGNAFYNIPAAVRIKGPVDIDALHKTFNEIVRRHESLRTTFDRVDDQPVQIIAESLSITLDVEDLTNLPESEREAEAVSLATEEAQRPFDLSRGPLFRACLLKLADDDHLLLATMHHIISDGWSIGVFINELGVLYEAFSEGKPSPLPDLPIQYAEFANWQREWLQGEAQEKQLSYWANQLAGAPTVLDLPTDRPRPPVQTFRGSLHSIRLSETLSDALKALSRKEGATLFMTLLAAFKTLLYKYSGQEDILVGTPIANRNRSEIEGLIGFFANTLVMRGDLSGDVSFRDFLRRVREMSLEAYAHQDVPFEQLVEHLQPERDMSRSPLFQTMFVLQNAPGQALQLPGLTFKTLDVDNKTAKFDLTLIMWDFENRLDAVFEYNSDLYDAATIRRLAGHFENLLEAIVAAPELCLSALSLLGAKEREEVLYGWNDTETDYGRFRPITDLIEAQVERTPNAIAVIFDGQQLTYSELNSRANQVANYLQRLGVGPEVSVGISVERSLEMAVGVLGILKAGGIYVPIDPAYPVDRQAFMLEDTQAPVLLTLERLVNGLPETNAKVIRLDADWEEIAQSSTQNPDNTVMGENLVYVVYTSGSTGRPKGVGWSHEALINMIDWMMQDSELKSGARTVQYASLSFDVSAQEIYPTWATGNTLVLLKEEVRRDAEQLLKFLSEQKVERLFIPFVALQHFAEVSELRSEIELSLQEVITAGEQLQMTRHLRRLFDKLQPCNLHNFYGPSEGNIVTVYRLKGAPDEWPALPSIGKPIANTQVHVLDRNLNPVPAGVTGELYIAGVVLARGYLNRPDMTAEKFIPNPFSRFAGERMYKTGDVARYLPNGDLEFLGRVDHQVKIRGFRVELGEVESVLSQHPAIKEAVVIAREDVAGQKRLVAYVVVDQPGPSTGELKSFLKEKLPEYMVPSAFVKLEEFPLSPNRKVDRKALPAPEQATTEEREYEPPRDETEATVANIWAEVLGLERVSLHDNFFELGGHSLLATQVVSRIKESLKVQVPLRTIFEAPTVAGLALAVMQNAGQSQDEQDRIISAKKRSNAGELLADIDGLSEEELNALLSDMMAQEQAS